MQNQTIQTLTLPPLSNSRFSGLAGLLSNPAYLAHAEQVFTHGGELDPYAASLMQSAAEAAICTFGKIQATFAKLVLANEQAKADKVDTREIANVQFQLSVMLGEVS